MAGCEAAARWFQRRGYNPVPSRPDGRRGPMIPYREFWTVPLPENRYGHFRHTPSLQVMTGAAWRLAVVDLDGSAAVARWRAWRREWPGPPTWTVRTGGGGWHLWFALPDGLGPCPTRRSALDAHGLQRGDPLWHDGAKHSAIELLADLALVQAPPSRHYRTGLPYAWLPGRGPREIPMPAMIPAWVLERPSTRAARPPAEPSRRDGATAILRPRGARSYPRDQVLEAIPDKAALAASWGLRLTADTPNGAGWIRCHAVGRADADPSAGFHVAGVYSEPLLRSLGLFDLAVELGAYGDWRDACDALGAVLLG